MTTDQIDVLEAGLDMDWAVAEACHVLLISPRGVLIRVDRFQSAGDPWRPSTDWNDAMYAAERFGLFSKEWPPLSLIRNRGIGRGDGETEGWEVHNYNDAVPDDEACVAFHESGPLAICRAILKLHAGGER